MGLSSAAARCGLYTASRTGFSSNRQLSVLPALNAYKPTLHVLFFVFVSHYSSAACNIQFLFLFSPDTASHCVLAVIQRCIKAVLCKQRLVVALLDDMTILHDQNDVRAADGGKTVCNDKARPAFHQLCKCILNL